MVCAQKQSLTWSVWMKTSAEVWGWFRRGGLFVGLWLGLWEGFDRGLVLGAEVLGVGESVVGLSLHPAAGVVTQDEAAALVVDEDEKGEGPGGEPPAEAERVHAQTVLKTRAVGQEDRDGRLKEQTKVQHVFVHSLLDQ